MKDSTMSKLRHSCLAALVAAGVAMVAAPAEAAVFSFTIATARDTSTGQFTVTGTASPFTVSSVSGTVDGAAITGLSGYGGADEQLSDTSPYADRAGIAFTAGGLAYNIFDNYTANGLPVYSFCSSAFDGGCTGGSANAAPVATFTLTAGAGGTVPEPAAWALLLAGFGLTGAVMRRRSMATVAA